MPLNLSRFAVPAAAAVGGLLAANGVLFLVAPQLGLGLFGLPGESSTILPPLLGIREIAFGLAVLLLARRGEKRSLAAFLLLGAVVPVVDAVVVSRATGSAAAWPHFSAIPVCLVLAYLLKDSR